VLSCGLLALIELRRKRMFPSEMAILIAITVAGNSSKKLLTQPMDVTGEYISYLYDSLVRCGYLKKDSSREYQLTSKGREALVEFLYTNKTGVKDAVKTLQQLGIEVDLDVDNLEKEAIKVS